MKKLLLAALLFTGVNGSALVAQVKIGHINTQEILVLLPERKQAENEVQKKAKDLQQEIEEMSAVFETRYREYLAEKESLSKAIQEVREQDLMDLQQRIQERQYTAEEDIQKLQQRLMEPMIKKVEAAISKVSKEQKFNYVFDTSVLVYFDGGVDISADVKKELGLTGEAMSNPSGK